MYRKVKNRPPRKGCSRQSVPEIDGCSRPIPEGKKLRYFPKPAAFPAKRKIAAGFLPAAIFVHSNS